jgi:hypothetical protein
MSSVLDRVPRYRITTSKSMSLSGLARPVACDPNKITLSGENRATIRRTILATVRSIWVRMPGGLIGG